MLYNAEALSERLTQHAKDYKEGKIQNFEQIFKDCEIAANMIRCLKRSKHTKKRETQRLRRRNEQLRETVKQVEAIRGFVYSVILNEESKKEIPTISRDIIEQFKKDLANIEGTCNNEI